jgi:hypothetical protein
MEFMEIKMVYQIIALSRLRIIHDTERTKGKQPNCWPDPKKSKTSREPMV